ncbi:hypothetical protein M422DRAFT_55106 [Sphaerobolus stellatus SS14]|uniref:Protein kinase domain-containing protein n=1 Tax=Sphaerobolus stellatus (strain SS14) TaxID=990650 RepID=A0A0C9UE92_SPHS4|nr:hypothetical protein M422DRAFT_55106 [Sphaerobolus stellatus SS14]
MDSSNLIPEGFQYASIERHDDLTPISFRGRSRKAVAPVQYYFIDFGFSIHFKSFENRIYVEGRSGQNKWVPQFIKDIPYDPFKLDIRQFGPLHPVNYVSAEEFNHAIQWCFDLKFFQALVESMMHDDFEQRPTASEALKQFEAQISSLKPEKLNERVVLFDESFKTRISSAIRSMRRRLPRCMIRVQNGSPSRILLRSLDPQKEDLTSRYVLSVVYDPFTYCYLVHQL